MSEEFYLCLDIGGTEIKVNLLDREQKVYFSNHQKYPSLSNQGKSGILHHFEFIVKSQLEVIQSQQAKLRGVGIAFPGPFDYKNGISLIKGLRKYDAIYQVNLNPYFRKWVTDMGFSVEVPLLFENDATAFSIGEYVYGAGQNADKAMFLTLGTGCGSTFIENGHLIKNKYGLKENGVIFQDPFLDGRMEDYLSAQGLKRIAERLGLAGMDGSMLYTAAQDGSNKSRKVFHEFGYLIGTALNRYVEAFQPNCIVFGGQISKSMNWMKDGISFGLAKEHSAKTEIKISTDDALSTFKGSVHLLNKKYADRWS